MGRVHGILVVNNYIHKCLTLCCILRWNGTRSNILTDFHSSDLSKNSFNKKVLSLQDFYEQWISIVFAKMALCFHTTRLDKIT